MILNELDRPNKFCNTGTEASSESSQIHKNTATRFL